MMRRRSLLRIDDSNSRRRRVAVQQCASISDHASSSSINLIDINTEPTGSLTSSGSSVTMMQSADLRNCDDLPFMGASTSSGNGEFLKILSAPGGRRKNTTRHLWDVPRSNAAQVEGDAYLLFQKCTFIGTLN